MIHRVLFSLHLVVEPRPLEAKSYKNYRVSIVHAGPSPDSRATPAQVVDAEVVPIAQLYAAYPKLVTNIDPTDLTRLRYVITLRNSKGDILRVRLVEWNDLGLKTWKELPKETSAGLAAGVAQALMYSVADMKLEEVQRKLGVGK